MQPEPLHPAQVDALLAYLDALQQRETPFAQWHGGRQPDGSFLRPKPAYAPEVVAFFQELDQPCWQDPDYNPRQAGGWLDHPRFIETAGYDRIRSMLTYCLRGEEASAGHWDRMLSTGKLLAVLQRLRYLRTEFPQTLEQPTPVTPISIRTSGSFTERRAAAPTARPLPQPA
jgi:hypothetical protein